MRKAQATRSQVRVPMFSGYALANGTQRRRLKAYRQAFVDKGVLCQA
jgi:hypothetical protein